MMNNVLLEKEIKRKGRTNNRKSQQRKKGNPVFKAGSPFILDITL